jgi:hypothetical protein
MHSLSVTGKLHLFRDLGVKTSHPEQAGLWMRSNLQM